MKLSGNQILALKITLMFITVVGGSILQSRSDAESESLGAKLTKPLGRIISAGEDSLPSWVYIIVVILIVTKIFDKKIMKLVSKK